MNQPPPPGYYYPHHRPPPPRKKVWPWVVGGCAGLFLLLLIIVVAVGAGQQARSRNTAAGPPTSRAQVQTPRTSSQTPLATSKPSGPVSQVSEGLYEVGVDMQPGKYKGTCEAGGYWSRLHSDDPTDYITNDLKTDGGLMQFTTQKGEYVEIRNCTFTKV